MSLKKSLIINTVWISLARGFSNLVGYFLVVLLSRYLGPEGMGYYGFAFSFVLFFFIFGDLGLNVLMKKDIAKDIKNKNKYISTVMLTRAILGFLSLIVYFFAVYIIDKPGDLKKILYIAGILWYLRHIDVANRAVLMVKHQGRNLALSFTVERIIDLVLGVTVLMLYKDLFLFFIVLTISSFVKLVIDIFTSSKFYTIRWNLDFGYIKKLLKYSYPFFIIVLFAQVYNKIDVVMLSFMTNDAVTGWYTAAYALIDVLNFIPILLLTFAFPAMSKLYEQNKNHMRILSNTLIRYLIIIMVPIIAGVMFLSHRIISFIYTNSFYESGIALKILIFAEFFVVINLVLANLISAANKQKVFMQFGLVGAVVNIVLNFILIPTSSYSGAAVSTLITFILIFVLSYTYVIKKIFTMKFVGYLIKPTIASLFMSILVYFMLNLPIIIIIPCAGVFYFIALYFLGLEKEDKEVLLSSVEFIIRKSREFFRQLKA